MKKQIISEEFLRMQKLAGLITESEFKRQMIKEMRIFDLKDKNGRSTELFKIEDFTTTEDAIKVLNKHFGLSGEDDDTIYTDETGTDYNYVYVANDGSARFVKSLDEFSDGYQTEEEWKVASSEEIKAKLNENEDDEDDDIKEGIYIAIDREPDEKEQEQIALAAEEKFFVDPKKIKFGKNPYDGDYSVYIPNEGDTANMLFVLKKFGIGEPPYTSPHLR
jgi:hypothetical protein